MTKSGLEDSSLRAPSTRYKNRITVRGQEVAKQWFKFEHLEMEKIFILGSRENW